MQQKISLFLIDLALILLTVSAKPFYFYQKIPRVIHKIEIKIKGNSTVGKYTCATYFVQKRYPKSRSIRKEHHQSYHPND